MNREILEHRLRQAFEGDDAEFRAVVRMAGDLHDARRYAADTGSQIAPGEIVAQCADAPSGTVADRWNWWMGALEHAYGGYVDFQVYAWERD